MKVTTKPGEPHTGSINGSSAAVLAPIPPAPLVEPAKRRRPVGLLAAAVVLAIAGGLGAVWAVNQSGERTDVVGVARQVGPAGNSRCGCPGCRARMIQPVTRSRT